MSRGTWRSRWKWLVGAVVGVVIFATAAFIVVQYATAASFGETQPAEGGLVRVSDVVVSAALPRLDPASSQVELIVDGQTISPDLVEVVPGAVRATVPLRDGPHWVKVNVSTDNMFARNMVANWSFTVDTTVPAVLITSPASPGAFNSDPTRLGLAFREPVVADLSIDGEEVALDMPPAEGAAESADGFGTEATAELSLSPGMHRIVVRATDRAGNVGSKSWTLWADFESPQVERVGWPEDAWDDPGAELVLGVSDDQPEGLSITVRLDGATISTAPAPAEDQPGSRLFRFDTGELFEGEHEITYRVVDRGGNVVGDAYRFLVDSSSSFGEQPLGPGALGRDVKDLQTVLARRGFTDQKSTGTFDDETGRAVAAFKASRGLSEGPVLDREAIVELLGSMVIDRSERKLYLYDGDELVKTYRVAVGQPRYPTPTGSYRIISKVRNPSWTPPPSPWADGLEPVPPGPGNPLGTRWMGLSAPHVGIHGTYQSSSIGTAASHGCIRMHIKDVEDLFELVYVGTPVRIVP